MVLREDAPKKCRGPRRPTTGRALRSAGLLHRIPLPRSGASPKWVSKASRQFRMSLGRRLHFCLSIPARSLCKSDSLSSARLHWSLRAAGSGGHKAPRRVRPRESRHPRKPTSPSPDVGRTWASKSGRPAKDLRLFFGGGMKSHLKTKKSGKWIEEIRDPELKNLENWIKNIGQKLPHNNRFNQMSLGRRAFRLRESHAGSLSPCPYGPRPSASFTG